MAKSLMVSGATLTGKTMVALGLASRLRAKGYDVSYFKPVGERTYGMGGESPDYDRDAELMKQVLKMGAKEECISPILRTMSSFDEMIKKGRVALLKTIHDCYSVVSEDVDFVLIEGTEAPWHLLHIDLSSPQIAKELGASVVCVVRFPEVEAIDEVLMHRDFFRHFGVESIGVILMMVPPMLRSTISESIAPLLERHGVRFCGAIYQNRELFNPTVRDIMKALDGQMVIGEDKLNTIVDEFVVGSMAPENALRWFRQKKGKAVITSGDRSDLCLAAMETDTRLLILVGSLGPDMMILTRAKELGIPIMVTAKDTYSTSQIVDHLVGSVSPENIEKAAVVERIVGESIDLDAIVSLMQ
ncbi:MAG: phosphotransacetylase family protein [Candidatus Thorarchaeota archaeon]|nr:phosphotransacetylase family protein [Candidatus Thorarchaeota archaeon]